MPAVDGLWTGWHPGVTGVRYGRILGLGEEEKEPGVRVSDHHANARRENVVEATAVNIQRHIPETSLQGPEREALVWPAGER